LTKTAIVWFSSDCLDHEERTTPMADELRLALTEVLRKAELERDADFLRAGVRVLSQALMELEVAQHVGAERHERTPDRTRQRNGDRDRTWDTRVGSLELRLPRVRDGSFFPSLLEPRRRAERALVAVVQEAYVQGVSTRRGRRPGAGARDERDVHKPGQPALRRAGRGG
jgi:transposase-like protein